MYVFTPGAGATGPSKLVKPGDELIFNSSYNPSDWMTDEWPGNEAEEPPLAHTCLAGDGNSGCKFTLPLPDEELVELGHKNFSPETMKQVRWVRKINRQWCGHRMALSLEEIVCDLEDKATITVKSLKFALCWFIMEVKKLDGTDYLGKTLYHLVICIQFR